MNIHSFIRIYIHSTPYVSVWQHAGVCPGQKSLPKAGMKTEMKALMSMAFRSTVRVL
jgi:hypothetical protein